MSGKIESIMVTTDFSDCGNTAINYAFSMAKQLNAQVTALVVVEKEVHDSHAYIDMKPMESDEVCAKVKKKYEKKLDELLVGDLVDGVDYKKMVVIDRNAELGIDHAQEKHKPDLLIIASHGYSGFKKFLLGSTTDRVMRIVECPVLVIKTGIEEN